METARPLGRGIVNWTGDIYHETSGDYRISTEYSPKGSFSTLRFRGKIVGYGRDAEEAKRKAEEHARQNA